ncbi:MAG TPA: carboxypeptidase regulatory-like domain-containing protein, partial [Bacteroidales bacterium]|nr:carboxypeptidase regulatory-like domain-containing protein [Bacteroidales bacterium]
VHVYGPAGYFNDMQNGVTNGYAWYEINGGRQDYMNYYHHCREVTVEISAIKTLPASMLLNYWEYNYRSFLNYIRESHYGFNGIVTDTVTDLPVSARVFIQGHDMDFSEVWSRPTTGYYCRPIFEGTYDVTFSAAGYFTKTIPNVTVSDRQTTSLDVQLRPLTYDAQDKTTRATLVFPNPSNGNFRLILPEAPIGSSCALQVMNTMGSIVHSQGIDHLSEGMTVDISLPELPAGIYFVRFNSGHRIYCDKLVIRK